MNDKRHAFSAAKYRQIAQNPFVDRKMLQFVRERTVQKPAEHATGGAPARVLRTTAKPVISEEAAKLIAAAIRGLLRE